MRIDVSSYIPGSSPVHACDARVKIVLLAAYSVALFLVDTWTGLALCALLFVAVAASSGVPVRRFFALLVPVYVIAGFAVLFNGFAFDVSQAVPGTVPTVLGGASAGMLASSPPVALIGSFGFVPAGFARGCFFAARIVLLVVASLVVTYTTTSTALTDALADFLRPLRRLRVPVDDIAMVFSLALRFIPVTAEEFGRVHDAQQARGAAFAEGTLWQRLRAWQTVLIPLFVGLFRRADALAAAMDARCYGAGAARTSLRDRRFTAKGAGVLAVGIAACAALAWFL
ncbi:energy-coupling factor transporter transmembrane protein EcfT [Gordonibacter sp. 28C]|uniref:energy-coupling factor transporter transmembrane component T family protein n=1 Tax=Gordonibacter sp. 28C TaxID=2078569 RepID=UPI000DF798B8|nr:energy-coupling factor transporter transmembrane protein EcfT [Gordonibacter sp. 28C]RDB64689.1 energy-coupling factor transporter transmembrane protein EcfT [Gordonibacter sp. 28C]